MRIQILNELLANQIAAGEVVERPSSVVKELMENSLDAGARLIKIEIEKGGSKSICVIDDGCGIHQDDLLLAVSRHATSKISNMSDLESVLSLGFRGEALASISSVSRFRLASAQKDQPHGWEVKVEGRIQDHHLQPKAHAVGTMVEVNDLFFNTPARRKFLRSEKTEFNHIEEVVKRLILSRFDVAFLLKHNQRQVIHVPVAEKEEQKQQRIISVCGQSFMDHAVKINFDAVGLQLEGWISMPQFSRSQSDMQYFFVNGRIIRDKLVNHAVRMAYKDVLFQDRHSAFVLYLTIDPTSVDVNVHPTKHEVRFRDSRLVHDFLLRALKSALEEIRPATSTVQKPLPHYTPTITAPLRVQEELKIYEKLAQPLSLSAQVPLASSSNSAEFILQSDQVIQIEKENSEPHLDSVPVLGFALAQLHGIYILAENEHGLIIVDMHAAHERVLYEKMKRQFTENKLVSQSLLIPLTMQLSSKEVDFAETKFEYFQQSGFDLARVGPESLIVRAVPAFLQHQPIATIIQDVISDLMQDESSIRIEHQVNELFASLACRTAAQANCKLSIPEMNALLREMEKTNNSSVCNHGRPTWRQFTIPELDRFFLRGR